MQFERINSKRLQALLEAKSSGRISTSENEELGLYAQNFANIILRTPKMRRFLIYNDPTGLLDLENEIRAQIAITIIGICPYKYEANAGKAYSYCLYCSFSAACGVIKKQNKKVKCYKEIERVWDLFGKDYRPYHKKNLVPTPMMNELASAID